MTTLAELELAYAQACAARADAMAEVHRAYEVYTAARPLLTVADRVVRETAEALLERLGGGLPS